MVGCRDPCPGRHQRRHLGAAVADRSRHVYDAYRHAGGPGRIVEPSDFTMVLAQFGHFAAAAARRWMEPASPERKDSYEAWFRAGWDQPFGMTEISEILDALI